MLRYFLPLTPAAFNQLCEIKCDALRDLVQFVQSKKHKIHPWSSVTFSTKSNSPLWVFFTCFKLHKLYQMTPNGHF